ncbi:hypothetical protein G210_5778 [Candida maltosa Xu316]|uniref:Micro-fibrillar-associated protein 1 C-terminal domain-containing protein n=1 Tax=Candida maltosa (strain Xu316) TaxID=1245528 RepID=M3K3X1_CANMX|nr:hypothetical protein G210_5778 [Candida maltosa Xu316]
MSSSEYESSGDESSSSSSEEEVLITKPVYISKTQRNEPPKQNDDEASSERQKQIINSKLDQKIEPKESVTEKDEYDGIDDTDDINPEIEFENWKLRELERFKRDQEIIKQLELEKEDQLRRKINGNN